MRLGRTNLETKLDFRGVNSINFYKRFKDDKDCYNYLADIKWPDENFKCKKCGHNKYCSGKKPFSRRWLRGIHHHCSREHLQGYLDEFHFRFNRRNNMDTIFNLLLKRMIENEPKPTKSIS